MSESNNNIPMRITQLEEATGYENGMYYPVAKAGAGTFKIPTNFITTPISELQKFDVRNIFTLNGATYGTAILSDGSEVTNANTGHTTFLDISSFAGTMIVSLLKTQYTRLGTTQGAFYDENKNYISGFYLNVPSGDQSEDEEREVEIPPSARYVILSFYKDRMNDYYINCTTKISINMLDITEDIFTTVGATLNHYARASDGAIVSTTGVGCTDFIDISAFDFIVTSKPTMQTHQGALYDKNFNYVVGYISPSGLEDIVIPIPATAKYIRISYVLAEESSYYANATARDINKIIKSIIEKPESNYSTFKMNCLGDSITYGYIPDSGAQMSAPYPSQLKEILGLSECRNYGISGSTLAVNSGNYDPMCVRYANMDNDANIVSVFGGTNDYGRGVYTPTLGTINDSVNTTVYGALNILAEGLINKYPRAFVFFITPMRRADKTGNNGGGYSLEDVSNAIKEVAFKYNFPVLDLFSKGGFHVENADFRAIYSGNDKLHPSQDFVTEHLAPMIARFIESNI